MKFIILISFALVIFTSACLAAQVQRAEVRLTVANRPPDIAALSLSPGVAYHDTRIACITAIEDDQPETAQVLYQWSVNGKTIEATGERLDSSNYLISEGDMVTCSAFVRDKYGAESGKTNMSLIISASPASVRMIQPVLSFAGSKITTESMLASFTGMTTGGSGDGNLVLMLLVFAVIILSLNMLRLISPTQD